MARFLLSFQLFEGQREGDSAFSLGADAVGVAAPTKRQVGWAESDQLFCAINSDFDCFQTTSLGCFDAGGAPRLSAGVNEAVGVLTFARSWLRGD